MAIGKSTRSVHRFARAPALGQVPADGHRSRAKRTPSEVRSRPSVSQLRDLLTHYGRVREIFDAIDKFDESRAEARKRITQRIKG